MKTKTYIGGAFEDDDQCFPKNRREYQNFQRFDKALKDAQTGDKSVLSKNVNLAAQIATSLTSAAGIRHVVTRLCRISKDEETRKETAVYAADSIMRHLARNSDEALLQKYELHLQAHMRNIFKRALKSDSTRKWLADRFLNKILLTWKNKGWFAKDLPAIVEVVHKCVPGLARPEELREEALRALILRRRPQLPVHDDEGLTEDGDFEDDGLDDAGKGFDGGPLLPSSMGGAVPKAGAPPTPMQPNFLAAPATPVVPDSKYQFMGTPEFMQSIPATPNIMAMSPMTPAGNLPMTPNPFFMSIPATPRAGGPFGAPMTPLPGAVPATPRGGVPMTPLPSGVPATPRAGAPAPSTPCVAGYAPFTPRGPIPSVSATMPPPAVPFTPRPSVQPFTPRGPVPATPGGHVQPFTPRAPIPASPGSTSVPFTPGAALGALPGTPGALQPFTPRGPIPASPGSTSIAPFTPAGPFATPATPGGPVQPFTPFGPTPATPGPPVQPFTPRGPTPATPGGPAVMPFTPRGPAPATPFVMPFTPRGPAVAATPRSAAAPGTAGGANTGSPASSGPVTPAGAPPPTPATVQPFTPAGPPPATPGRPGVPGTPLPGTPGFMPVMGGDVAPQTPMPGALRPVPPTPGPLPGTPGFVPFAGGHVAPQTPAFGARAAGTPRVGPGTPGWMPLADGNVAPVTPLPTALRLGAGPLDAAPMTPALGAAAAQREDRFPLEHPVPSMPSESDNPLEQPVPSVPSTAPSDAPAAPAAAPAGAGPPEEAGEAQPVPSEPSAPSQPTEPSEGGGQASMEGVQSKSWAVEVSAQEVGTLPSETGTNLPTEPPSQASEEGQRPGQVSPAPPSEPEPNPGTAANTDAPPGKRRRVVLRHGDGSGDPAAEVPTVPPTIPPSGGDPA